MHKNMGTLKSLVLLLQLGALAQISQSLHVEKHEAGSPSSLFTPWAGKRVYPTSHFRAKRGRSKREYSDMCEKTFSLQTTNFYKINSPYFPKRNYKPSSSCEWTFIGSNLCQPQIVCPVVEIKDAEGCEDDFLSISDAIGGGMKMCGSAGFLKPLIASRGGRTLFISFEGTAPAPGFVCEISCAKPKNQADVDKMMNHRDEISINRIEIDLSEVDVLPVTAQEAQTSSKCVCGLTGKPTGKGGRIAGGKTAKQDEFPWQAAIVAGANSRRPMCGASIINNLYILSAAHCFYTYNKTLDDVVLVIDEKWKTWNVLIHALNLESLNQSTMNAQSKFGDEGWMYAPGWNFSKTTDASEKSRRFKIDKRIIHPMYNKDTFDFDAVLLKVDAPINIEGGDLVTPICLPKPSEAAMRYGGLKPFVVGWGKAQEKAGTTTRALQKLEVPVYPLDACKDIMRGIKLFERFICAGYPEGGHDACQGDSGGPLALLMEKQWTQIGIVSSGDGCARKDRLGLYTRVTEMIGWIQYNANIDIDDDGDLVDEEEGRVLWCQRDLKKKS